MKKNLEFPDYPADGEDGLVSVAEGTLNYPGLMDFLHEMKEKTYGQRDTMTIGEVSGVTDETLFSYIDPEKGVMDMIFDFSYADIGYVGPNYFWFEPVDWTAEELKKCLFESQEKVGDRGWLGLCLESHDLPRCIDRLLPEKWRNYYGATMLAMMYMLLRGTPFVYQGQEIGMRNTRFPSIECYDDCSSQNQYRMAIAKGFTEKEALAFVWEKNWQSSVIIRKKEKLWSYKQKIIKCL